MLIGASIAVLPYTTRVYPLVPSFLAAFVSATGVFDFLTALMLLQLFLTEGKGLFLGAACGYLISSLLVWPYGVTFPGLVPAAHAFSNEQSAVSLWLCWHMLFPVLIAFGALRNSVTLDYRVRKRAVWSATLLSLAIVALLIYLVTVKRDLLPYAVHLGAFTTMYTIAAAVATYLNLGALIVIARFSAAPVQMRVWLSVALIASALDLSLNAVIPRRFTLPWYLGKVEMLVTASVLLVALMRMWVSLYSTSISLTRSLRLTMSDRTRLQQRFEREHLIAGELQQASLPRSLPACIDARLSAVYRPAVHDLEIGGDWYDAFVLEDGRLALTVGDVSGKGLAASLVMANVRQMLRIAAITNPDPAEMLNITDRALRIGHGDTIVTAFVAIMDRDKRGMLWASAGHPPSLLRHQSGEVAMLESCSLPLGLRSDDPPSARIALPTGSMLVAYTDGLVEATLNVIEGIERVTRALRDPQIYAADDSAQALFDRVIGMRARDDIAIVTVKLFGPDVTRVAQSWEANSESAGDVANIRLDICRLLREQELGEEIIFNVELVYSELIGNVKRYAPGAFTIELHLDRDELILRVADDGEGFRFTSAANVDWLAESGRGLFLVSMLCDSFEISPSAVRGSVAQAVFALDDPV